jgi:hypothetical protein
MQQVESSSMECCLYQQLTNILNAPIVIVVSLVHRNYCICTLRFKLFIPQYKSLRKPAASDQYVNLTELSRANICTIRQQCCEIQHFSYFKFQFCIFWAWNVAINLNLSRHLYEIIRRTSSSAVTFQILWCWGLWHKYFVSLIITE